MRPGRGDIDAPGLLSFRLLSPSGSNCPGLRLLSHGGGIPDFLSACTSVVSPCALVDGLRLLLPVLVVSL